MPTPNRFEYLLKWVRGLLNGLQLNFYEWLLSGSTIFKAELALLRGAEERAETREEARQRIRYILPRPELDLEGFTELSILRDRLCLMHNTIIANLPAVETATLPEGEQSCPICMETYVDTNPGTTAIRSQETPETESAIRLRCNHVFGKTYFKTWLQNGVTTCPLCRGNIFCQEEMKKTMTTALDAYVLSLIFPDG
ncbi:hypothetical protein MMC07_000980 [Pseudocyphellaria aurata]|nr:hypothetical protein [Pseudocyphellaria aurata]